MLFIQVHFSGSHTFLCQSLLLSTTVRNDECFSMSEICTSPMYVYIASYIQSNITICLGTLNSGQKRSNASGSKENNEKIRLCHDSKTKPTGYIALNCIICIVFALCPFIV